VLSHAPMAPITSVDPARISQKFAVRTAARLRSRAKPWALSFLPAKRCLSPIRQKPISAGVERVIQIPPKQHDQYQQAHDLKAWPTEASRQKMHQQRRNDSASLTRDTRNPSPATSHLEHRATRTDGDWPRQHVAHNLQDAEQFVMPQPGHGPHEH